MIKISLNLPHKRKQFIILTLVILCALIILISAVVSGIFYKKIKETSELLEKTQSVTLQVKFVLFNPFKGLSLYGLEAREKGDLLLKCDRLDIGFNISSLLRREISIKNINVYESRLYADKITALFARKGGWQESVPSQNLGFFETVHLQARNIWIDDIVEMDLSGYLSFIRQKFFIARGKMLLKSIQIPGAFVIKLSDKEAVFKSFDCALEAEYQDSDLVVTRCEFINSSLQFFGKGLVKDYKNEANVSLSLKLANAVLDNFPFLNTGHFQSRGLFDAELILTGPARALDFSLKGKMTNVQMTFFDSVSFEKVNGSFVFFKNQLTSRNFCFRVNGMDLCSNLDLTFKDHPHLLFKLFTPEEAQHASHFDLAFEGDWIDKSLKGLLNVSFRYSSEKTVNLLTVSMEDFHLGLHKERLFFSASAADGGLDVKPSDKSSDVKHSYRDVAVEKLFSFIEVTSDGITFDGIKAVCYGGRLLGGLKLFPAEEAASVIGKAHLDHVDLRQVFQVNDERGPILSGHLSGVFTFDSESPRMLKGDFSVADGSIEKDPLLNSVADFLGVASLKKVAFDKLAMTFYGGKGNYASQVRLFSDKVNAFLDAKIIGYDKINGYLSASLATDLLNESKQFSKILKYIKHSESEVIFPFQISSYVESPRVLWLKNEFKDKLSNLLPESNKRYLQQQLNSMVEKMAEE